MRRKKILILVLLAKSWNTCSLWIVRLLFRNKRFMLDEMKLQTVQNLPYFRNTKSYLFSFFSFYLFSSWMIEWSYWSIVDHGSIIFFTVQNSILFLELVLHITFTFLPFNIFSCVTLHQHFQQYFYLMILIYNIQKYLKEGTLYLLSSEMHYYWLCNK